MTLVNTTIEVVEFTSHEIGIAPQIRRNLKQGENSQAKTFNSSVDVLKSSWIDFLYAFDSIRQIPPSVQTITMKTNTFIVLDFNLCVQIFAANEFFSLMCHFHSFFFSPDCRLEQIFWVSISVKRSHSRCSFGMPKARTFSKFLPAFHTYVRFRISPNSGCVCVCVECWHIYVSNKILR